MIMDSKDNYPQKNHHFYQALGHALSGIYTAFKSERNLRFHCFAAVVVIFLAFILQVSIVDWCFLLLAITLVIAGELINTAIEAVVDITVGKSFNEKAKKAKDVAAGMVTIYAFFAVIIGVIVFVPKLVSLL